MKLLKTVQATTDIIVVKTSMLVTFTIICGTPVVGISLWLVMGRIPSRLDSRVESSRLFGRDIESRLYKLLHNDRVESSQRVESSRVESNPTKYKRRIRF